MADPTKDLGATGDLWRTFIGFSKQDRRSVRWLLSPRAWAEIRMFKYEPTYATPLGLYAPGDVDTLFGRPVIVDPDVSGVSYD